VPFKCNLHRYEAELQLLWNAPPPPGESLADRLAREAAATTATNVKQQPGEEKEAEAGKTALKTASSVGDGATNGSKTDGGGEKKTTAAGAGAGAGAGAAAGAGGQEASDGVAGQLWGMLAAVDWAGIGAAAGSAGAAAGGAALDGAGIVGAALGDVELQWSQQVNPDNDSVVGLYKLNSVDP
jgi:hypothetical protein